MRRMRHLAQSILFAAVAGLAVARAQPDTIAIVGATVIDGTGGAPTSDGVIVIAGSKISAVGPRARVTIPPGAREIDGRGKFVVPGFIDTNVHLSLYGGMNDRYETLVRYADRQEDIVLEAAQIDLRYGVTTVRDSYGMLRPLVAVRDRIARGGATGSRILAAGNIVGWSGPYSISFSLTREQGLTLFQEQMNDEIAQGAGEELMELTPSELARAIDAYLDKGPDFLKYGGTSHFSEPTFIGFSPEAQRTLVERTHARGRFAETHSTSLEGLRLAIDAGIDGIQHPEMVDGNELPDDLVKRIVDRRIVCSMLASTIAGEAWQKHLKDRAEAGKKQQEDDKKSVPRPRTSFEQRKRATDLGAGLESRRANAQKLIRAGAVVTVGTDSYWAAASELSRTPKPQNQDHGIGTIMAIEGLVELGMTPAQAIAAGTRNGAIAARGLDSFGTIENGKEADLVVLDADPLAAIGNIRRVNTVIKGGAVVDRNALPQERVLSKGAPTSSPQF
jgi:imidazolonepropionase-like amidohydrolase